MSNSPNSVSTAKKWYQKVPPVFVLLLIIIFISAILTYIIPAGEFDRVMLEDGSREVVAAIVWFFLPRGKTAPPFPAGIPHYRGMAEPFCWILSSSQDRISW